jgi:CheY-like chemotaxis protein
MMTMTPSEKTILVVDDSTTNVVLLDAILSEKGYRIIKTLSAMEAYACMEKQLPDLILLDLLMPQINGFDFLKKVKADQRTADIPVIVISAVTNAEDIKLTKDLGAAEFMEKPINIQNLNERVTDLLKIG